MGTFSDLVANSWLDAVCRATAYSEAGVYVSCISVTPARAGTANPAANTTRVQATFGTGATGRAISNTAADRMDDASRTPRPTPGSSSGMRRRPGTSSAATTSRAPAAVTAGDTFRIPIGDLDLTVT